MAKILILLLALSVLSCCEEKNVKENNLGPQCIDTLDYSWYGFNSFESLYLLSDGRFILNTGSFSCSEAGMTQNIRGNYKKSNATLSLFPERIETKQYYFGIAVGVLPWKTESPYGLVFSGIETKYSIIRWGRIDYLLSPTFRHGNKKHNDFINFAHDLNAGINPENYISRNYFAGRNYVIDTSKIVFDFKQIPEEYLKYFLQKNIEVKIEKIDETRITYSFLDRDDIIYTIQINKGEKDGIFDGLSFTTRDGEFCFAADSILPHKSFGKSWGTSNRPRPFRVGTKLRNRWN